MEQAEIVHALETCEFFQGLKECHTDQLIGFCRPVVYQAGECVFRQGDAGEYIYVIADGQVVLERSVDLATRRGKIILDVLRKGRILGCWSTLLGETHVLMSTAVCQKLTELVAIKGADLRQVMLENKELGFSLMERFCSLLRARIQAAYGAMDRL